MAIRCSIGGSYRCNSEELQLRGHGEGVRLCTASFLTIWDSIAKLMYEWLMTIARGTSFHLFLVGRLVLISTIHLS